MNREDITPQMEQATSTPEEALENIQGAKVFAITPDIYKEYKTELAPELKKRQMPKEATPIVARHVASSPEVAAALAPDIEQMSWLEKQYNYIKERVTNKVGPERELIELGWKKMRSLGKNSGRIGVGGEFGSLGSDEFTDEDYFRHRALKNSAKNNFGARDYGLESFVEKLPGEVAAQAADMVDLAARNKELIGSIMAGTTAVTSATGAAIGSIAGGVGAIPGAITGAAIGAKSGLVTGYLTASFYDAYKTVAGSTFNELEDARDRLGEPLQIDDEHKMYLAHGVGLVSGSLSFAADKLIINKVPFLKRLIKGDIGELVNDPAYESLRSALIGIGRAAAIDGTEEGAQEIAQIMGEEIGNTYKDGEVAVLNGLLNGLRKSTTDRETLERIGGAAAVGAVTTGTITAAGTGADRGIRKAMKRSGEPGKLQPPEPPPPKTDIISDLPPHEQAARVLEFQELLDAGGKVMENTKLGQSEAGKAVNQAILKEMVEGAGVKQVWVDKENLNKLAAGNEEKAQQIMSFVDAGAADAGRHNAPMLFTMENFLKLRDSFPEVSRYVKLTPEGPNSISLSAWAQREADAKQKRAQLREKLGTTEQLPQERAGAVDIGTGPIDDEGLAATLQTQEVADAFLARLDQEIVSAVGDAEQISRISDLHQRVTALRETLPAEDNYKNMITVALETPDIENEIWSEDDYRNELSFPEAIIEVVPEKEREKVLAANRAAKQAVIDNINETAQYEMNSVIDVVEDQLNDTQFEMEMQRLEGNPRVDLVERFTETGHHFRQTSRFHTADDLTQTHHKPGFSPLAIDPRTLTPEQKELYAKHPQLKKHKAFVKGGISPDDAAVMLGVRSGDILLEVLASTPSRRDIAQMRADKRKEDNRKLAEASVDINETALAKAYHAKTVNHLTELKYLISERWADTKKIITRVALKLPKVQTLRNDARKAVRKTKVGHLNPNQFKIGERRSERTAIKAVLDGNLPLAFKAKENAARNSELTFATHEAIHKVNRVRKLAKQLKRMKNEIREAGPILQNAIEEFTDVFNLDPSNRGAGRVGAYQKFVKQQIKLGNGNLSMNMDLSDTRQSLNDMTVEEVILVGERLQSLIHQVKMKNKLYGKFGDPKALQTFENIKRQILELLQSNPNAKKDRPIVAQSSDLSAAYSSGTMVSHLSAKLKNMEHILTKAGNDQVGNILVEVMFSSLKGNGKFAGQGEKQKGEDMLKLQKVFKSMTEEFVKASEEGLTTAQIVAKRAKQNGLNEWDALRTLKVDVPEFRGNKKLYNGKLTMGDLLMILLNLGNEGNKEQMAVGFDTDVAKLEEVVRKHLDKKYFTAAQRIFDMFAELYPRVSDLHYETQGVRPEFVEPTPIIDSEGNAFRGGYFPIMYQSEMTWSKLRKRDREAARIAAGEGKDVFGNNFYASDMTRHNHTEKRKGSDEAISLSMDNIATGLEMVLHDLNFRKPLADSMKILTDPDIAKALAEVIGNDEYNVVFNTLVDASKSVTMENNALRNSNNLLDRMISRTLGGASVGYLAGNLSSMAMQIVSSPMIPKRMGKGAYKHLSQTLVTAFSSPANFTTFFKLAYEILPSLEQARQGYDENTRGPIQRAIPQKYLINKSAALHYMMDRVIDIGFKPFGMIDNAIKATTAVASYNQFMAGDAAGFSYEKVMAMTREERDHHAKVYASSVARLTGTTGTILDKADVQKNHRIAGQFYNDGRNVFNNILWYGREATGHAKAGRYRKAATVALESYMTLVIMRAMIDGIKNNPTPWDEEASDELEDIILDSGWYAFTAPVELLTSNIPVVRDIEYARKADEFWELANNTPSTPLVNALTHGKQTIDVLVNFMDVYSGMREVTPQETKALMFSASYLRGGIPVKLLTQVFELAEANVDLFSSDTGPDLIGEFGAQADEFIEEYGDEVPPEVVETIKDVKDQLQPVDEASIRDLIPPETLDVIKQIESGGEWWAKNPNSSAAGLYQFTEGTWADIMDQAPELGLTEYGRVSSDTEQQERAMAWFTEQNAQILLENDIELNVANIYAAHFLGADTAVRVLKSPSDNVLGDLISRKAIEANNFTADTKVRDFKSWVSRKVSNSGNKLASLDKGGGPQED